MSPRVFALPDLGEGLTDAELVRWLIAVGDEVRIDQAVAEVETAKSIVEVPSPFAGTVAALHGAEGDTILVGAPLIEVAEAATEGAAAGSAAGGNAAAETPAASAPAASEAPAASSRSASGQVLVGYGTTELAGRRRARGAASAAVASQPPARPAPPATPARAARAAHTVPVISPVVRSLARSHGVDLASVRPSGPGGVITRRDVEAVFAATATAAAHDADRAAAPSPSTDSRTGLRIAASTPFNRLRRTVAETMTRSRSEIPEATVWVDVDATELWESRRRLASGAGRAPSLLAFIGRFALAALERHPELAGRVTADGLGLETFEGVNLGFAADTNRGLMVPVVRRADRLSVRELDAELSRLTEAVRSGSLPPSELTGSTFTINNYGSLGVDGSAAIINHPEVAILGIGRMIERPWVVDGAIVPRRIAQLSLVFDHRVTDGGVAAGFLREVADAVESPLSVLADARPA